VAKLLSKSAARGLCPVQIGGHRLDEVTPDHIWSIAPFPGQEGALAAALPNGLPAPNRTAGRVGARLVWSGRAQAFWIGAAAPDAGLAQYAALSDQTDGWCVLKLSGPRVEAVLARVTPLDLHPGMFKRGHTARTLLGHMSAQITRLADGVEIMVFRSMAGTAVHEIEEAMKSVAARSVLSD